VEEEGVPCRGVVVREEHRDDNLLEVEQLNTAVAAADVLDMQEEEDLEEPEPGDNTDKAPAPRLAAADRKYLAEVVVVPEPLDGYD
jgi:hypothetical protein